MGVTLSTFIVSSLDGSIRCGGFTGDLEAFWMIVYFFGIVGDGGLFRLGEGDVFDGGVGRLLRFIWVSVTEVRDY